MNLIIHCHKQSRGGYILYNNWTLSHIRWNGGVERYDVTVVTKTNSHYHHHNNNHKLKNIGKTRKKNFKLVCMKFYMHMHPRMHAWYTPHYFCSLSQIKSSYSNIIKRLTWYTCNSNWITCWNISWL